MKSVRLFLLFCLIGAAANAKDPLYTVKLKSTATFELLDATKTNWLSFYPLTKNITKGKRNVVGADYQTGIKIKTKKPAIALQDILRQIGEQTGLMATYLFNTNLTQIAPTALLHAYSETATITLLLTPKEEDVFILTCAFVINERPEGSVDGTPAGVAQMEEKIREFNAMMNADSIATTLPAKIAVKDLKREEYFRGGMEWAMPDKNEDLMLDKNGTAIPVLGLIVKKKDDYMIGLYEKVDDTWTLMDQPVALSGVKHPSFANIPASPATPPKSSAAKAPRFGFRANKTDGTGGFYIFAEAGHVFKTEF